MTGLPEISLADPAVHLFLFLPLWLFVGLLWGVDAASRRLGEPATTRRRALATTVFVGVVWLAATWAAAATGVLRLWDAIPPPFALLPVGILALAGSIALTSYGRRLADGLPLWTLVAIQGFRLPLELAMHEMFERGVMPVQMSYSGLNFDILTGVSALVVAGLVFARKAGRPLVFLWNTMGLLLVTNVVTIGVLSTPAFRLFGDEQLNVWITYPPFVWLPAVMVLAAVAGHLLVFRALLARRRAQ